MTVFASKDAFEKLGLEQVQLSHTHISQDCAICTQPLTVQPASAGDPRHQVHPAVRIAACGHLVGQECLSAWLDVGNSCPACNRLLFELTGDLITQQDVNNIIRFLGPVYGEDAVTAVVGRSMVRQEQEQKRLKKAHEAELAKMKMKETQAQSDGFSLSDEDLLDIDEEMDFGEDDGDFEEQEGASDSM